MSKKIMKKRNRLRATWVLGVVVALVVSPLSALAVTIDNVSSYLQTDTQTIDDSSRLSSFEGGWWPYFQEGFENASNWPPITDPFGLWKIENISSQTWHLDPEYYWEGEYSACVNRGNYEGFMDEWLITPSLDFSHNDSFLLIFRWALSDWVAREANYVDLNVSISIDNEQTWTFLWNENNEPDWQSWDWIECELDLSDYAGNPDVRLCFQFISRNDTDSEVQICYIDSVKILAESPINFWCDIGPDETIAWSWNHLHGIKFRCTVGGGTLPYVNWSWKFGDGNSSTLIEPVHNYGALGTYNVELKVQDSRGYYAIDYKNITVKEYPPSRISIDIKNVSLGIVVELTNTGLLNVTEIAWKIEVEWGLRRNLAIAGEDNITFLESKAKTTIRSRIMFFAPLFSTIHVYVVPLNSIEAQTACTAFKLGPLLICF